MIGVRNATAIPLATVTQARCRLSARAGFTSRRGQPCRCCATPITIADGVGSGTCL